MASPGAPSALRAPRARREVLTTAVDEELPARDVHDQLGGVIALNAGAIRFYQSRSFRPAWLELIRF
jgi:hypothetical protein